MIYQGKAVTLKKLDNDLAELNFDLEGESINKLNVSSLKDLRNAIDALKKEKGIKGLLITSSKDVFIAGADVTEFLGYMQMSHDELKEFFMGSHLMFNEIEDLNYPSVAAINGAALGGGLELCLSATYRMAAETARMGLPETKLGIIPGWGGTIRLPRLIGADNAIEWIAGGTHNKADAALKVGVVDGVVPQEKLREASLTLLTRAVKGELDWKAKTEEKKIPLKLNKIEAGMVFEGAKGFVLAKAGPNYPAPICAIETMQKHAALNRDEAIHIEIENMSRIIKTDAARSLTGIFLGDQYLKKIGAKMAKSTSPTKHAAVIGAGIMGGGVAYQSAYTGTSIVMKDIAPQALEKGMGEASKLLSKRVAKKRMTIDKMTATLGKITPTLHDEDLKNVDIVIEAVVENIKVKTAVLKDLEEKTKPGTILTSNTSTISITKLAEGLKHPENFCGMHFFNPVPLMPLVEVIRGEKTSDEAIAKTVGYALSMKKAPIVVNDCPGFLVNRILFAYFGGFSKLLQDGVDFTKIDKAMERFGMPMGPAYLGDVVGLDTCYHAGEIMAQGFDRMKHDHKTAAQVMNDNKRFGQKNGIGFYKYTPGKRGRLKKEITEDSFTLLKEVNGGKKLELSPEEIVNRMMLPMIFESSKCLEDKIVNTAIELDMGMIYGIGFPPFRGGVMQYADSIGMNNLLDLAKKYENLGELYKPSEQIVGMAKGNQTFYKGY